MDVISRDSNFSKLDESFADGSGFGDGIISSNDKETAVVNVSPDYFNGIIGIPDVIEIEEVVI
jgi:hypothetical protein